MCVTINISTMLKTNSFVGGGSARYEAPSILTLELLSESTVLNGSPYGAAGAAGAVGEYLEDGEY